METQKKQKALDNINYNMRADNTLAMIELVAPMATKVRKAYVYLNALYLMRRRPY